MGSHPSPHLVNASLAASQQSLRNANEAAALLASEQRADILRHFDAVFSEAPVLGADELKEAFRLRYMVYCLDRGFEDAKSCPSGLEQDRYDEQASHCLLRDRFGKRPIGTVRLVMTQGTAADIDGLPLAEYASEESLEVLRSLPRGSVAEVSRFAIARSAREILCQSQRAAEARFGNSLEDRRRPDKLLPYMSLGLIRGLVRLSRRHGVTHWCLAAEPSLLRRLRSFGLHFHNAGPLVEHRGLRQICYAALSDLMARAEVERPEIWDVMTNGGLLMSDERARTVA